MSTAVDYGRDICGRCHSVIAMPGDGSESPHVCLYAPVPWRRLWLEAGIKQHILRLMAGHAVRFGNARIASRFFRPEHAVECPVAAYIPDHTPLAGASEREGPFEPGCPPPPVLMSDLLLWSREDFEAVDSVGRRTLEKLEGWLRSHDLELASRDREAVVVHLVGAIRHIQDGRARARGFEDRTVRMRDRARSATDTSIQQLGRELDDHRYAPDVLPRMVISVLPRMVISGAGAVSEPERPPDAVGWLDGVGQSGGVPYALVRWRRPPR